MAFKLVSGVLAFVAVANAVGPVAYTTYATGPQYISAAHPYASFSRGSYAPFQSQLIASAPTVARAIEPEPFDPHPQYNYGYTVSDPVTGDSKTASESRDGDLVRGQYSLVEPDGAVRTVTYTADSLNGFNAVVERQPASVAAPVIAPAAPITVARPSIIG